VLRNLGYRKLPSIFHPNSPQKQPYHHGDLRAALVAAALKLIGEHGVKGFTLKDAARIAGVSVAAPYRHFADKEALLRAIQEEGFAAFDAALEASGERSNTPQERLIELGVAYLHFALEHPAHIRVMFGMNDGGVKAHPASVAAEAPTGYSLLVDAVAALDPHAPVEEQRDLVIACWSAVHGYAMLYLEGAFAMTARIEDPEAQLRRTLKRLVEGR
jgi:AcrR family transcriptional regulator